MSTPETNYVDARTPEERANEPKSTITYASLKKEALDLSELHEVEIGTPDTEWRRSEHIAMNIVHQIGDLLYETLPSDVAHKYFVDARQATNDKAIDFAERLIEKHISSRDTYWKERVRKEVSEHEVREEPVGGVIGWSNRVAEIEMFRRSLLQALDNLK